MDPNREFRVAIIVAVVLFILGVFSYSISALTRQPPEQPIRVVMPNLGGKVLFDHKTHTAGYGFACQDCHHHPPDDESALIACGNCHTKPAESEAALETCLDCHEQEDIEDYEMADRKNAYHSQCAGCHADIGAGPLETNDECNHCHVL